MNFSLAIILIAAIWVILIVVLLTWYLIVRSRRKKSTSPAPGPIRRGAAANSGAALDSDQPGHGNLPLGPDATQPLERLTQRPPSSSVGPEPFGLTTQQDYERLAAEPFQAPPATALGERGATERFSWAEASQSGSKTHGATGTNPTVDLAESPAEHPQGARRAHAPAQAPAPPAPGDAPSSKAPPASAVHKATGITNEPVASQGDGLDRTVVVSREAAVQAEFGWSLILPDGDALPLSPDCIVGRRPSATEGATPLVIADPTRTLSKSHARLRYDGERWWVIDLGSTNGLWLLYASGVEEEVQPYEEVEAASRLRLGTLEVELKKDGQTG